jgi:hypothetical protein
MMIPSFCGYRSWGKKILTCIGGGSKAFFCQASRDENGSAKLCPGSGGIVFRLRRVSRAIRMGAVICAKYYPRFMRLSGSLGLIGSLLGKLIPRIILVFNARRFGCQLS